MRSLAGAIVLLAASICFAAGLVGQALGKDSRGDSITLGIVAALILGVIGVVVLFVGILDKRE